MNKIYDAVVIGGGVAGYYCARELKKGGKSVALIERETLGGTSLISGALPIKKILDSFKNNNSKKKDIRKDLLSNWHMELNKLNEKIVNDMENLGIHIYYGNGEFIDSKTFKINEDVLESQFFIIATGTSPASTKDIEIDNENVTTHIEAIDLRNIPNKVVILGGNVEGVELTSAFSELGAEVTLVEMEENILIENDKDLVSPIKDKLESLGVKIITGIKAKAVKAEEKSTKVILENGEEIFCDRVITTLFRKPNFPKGLENTEIQTDSSKILVNENLLTHEDNIFAIGDINGILCMGHAAIQQGLIVADHILNNTEINIDYKIFPSAVFTLPEMAGVGCQEWELKERNTPYKVGTYHFQDTWRGWANKSEGFTKVLLGGKNNILGVWMVGENVSEYIGTLGLVVKGNKTAEDILSNLIIHPSLTECLLEAIIDGKEKVIK